MVGRKPGTQKTGGRRKGSKNKRTLEMEYRAAERGITPLEYMLEVLRDETADMARRDWAAGAAAPYMHSRMPQAVRIGDPEGKPLKAPVIYVPDNGRGD